jgi:hypothetical protein
MVDEPPQIRGRTDRSDNTHGLVGPDVTVSPLAFCDATNAIPLCCVETIRAHVEHNAMMVCPVCKHIIKCFPDVRAHEHYVRFCQSRRRPIRLGIVDGHYTVTFRSYDTFAR